MSLTAGSRLGPYAVIAKLGEGGMGEVYRARDTRLDRDVALKILPGAFAADPDRRGRFEREAKAVAALSHPNILAIFDVGECDGIFYAATELLEGQTLRDRLSSGPLPTRKAIELAVQIARGLAAAHDRGIVHRDLKPENLFLAGDGQVKILDFGLARQAGPASGTGATETIAATDPGTVMGTLGYMAPEQARGQALDGRADLFSLGAVLYEMVTGERAFVRATAADTMSAILREDPPDISGTRADIPPAFDRIIRHCLEKEPDERFQTARDVAFALSTLSGPAPSASGAVPESAAARRSASSTFTALPFIAVSLVAIVGLAGWIWSATGAPSGDDPITVRFALSTAPAQELTTAVGMNLALSPDGKTLVYAAADSDGVTHLYRRTIDDLRQTVINGTERAASPFFSYDGLEIGFIVGNQLMKIPAAGGTASVLAEIERLGGVSFRGASWGPNGVIVSAASNLVLVPSQGGDPGPLAASGAIRGFWPVVLAGGDTLLYSTLAIADGPLGAVNLRSGATTELSVSGNVPLGVAGDDLIFARTDGRLYAIGFDAGTLRVTGSPRLIESEFARVPGSGEAKVAVSQNGTLAYVTGSGLVKVVESDLRGATRALPVRPGRLSFPRYSPDGRAFAADLSTSGRTDIYVYDLQSGAARRLTADGTLNERPEWSPGGDRILYKTDRGGPRPSLWWLPADGSGTTEQLVTSADKDIWQGMLSPDGKTVIYRTGGGGTGDIWSAPVGNGGGETSFATARFNELGPRFSPDGRAVAYYSDESGSYQVYVRPFPGPGAAIPVSVNGGQTPVWSRDGRTIYFANGRQFVAAAVDTAGSLSVADRKVLFERNFLAGAGHAAYDIAPDGKSVLMLIPESGEPEKIVVVRNLATELRAGASLRGGR